MILNKGQLNSIKKEIENLAERILKLESSDSIMDKIQVNAWGNRKKELNDQMIEFNKLTKESVFEFTCKDLCKLIISLRIASGMTQKQLAEAIEIQEQQIQRYERSQYLMASFDRIIQILGVLTENITLKVKVKKQGGSSTFDEIHQLYPCAKRAINCVKNRKALLTAS